MQANGDIYWINRDGSESERLDLQHEFLKKTLGYLLHPRTSPSLSHSARIADVATGTGVVCIDLARTLPSSCQLDGFDISASQFPPVEKLPRNVRLQVLDAKGSVPSDMRGKYDIVIIRYLVAAMGPQDWEVVARNAFMLLKPGGWLQWMEADVGQAITLIRGDPRLPISSKLAAHHALCYLVRSRC
jgi:SAM-dependent methyltransferase